MVSEQIPKMHMLRQHPNERNAPGDFAARARELNRLGTKSFFRYRQCLDDRLARLPFTILADARDELEAVRIRLLTFTHEDTVRVTIFAEDFQ